MKLTYRPEIDVKKNNLIFKEITSCTDDQIKKIRDLRNLENVRKFMYTDHIITEQEHINYITKLKNQASRIRETYRSKKYIL